MILPEELERIEFVRALGERYLNEIAMITSPIAYRENEIVFEEGHNSLWIYFVLSGQVGLTVKEHDGKEVEVYNAGPGEMLGWSPVLGSGKMTATARAIASCRLAAVDVQRIHDLCRNDPLFAIAILRETAVTVSDRLRATRRRLADLQRRPEIDIAS